MRPVRPLGRVVRHNHMSSRGSWQAIPCASSRVAHPFSFDGQDDTEAGPLAGGALELEAAPVIGHDTVADAQAQSGSFADGFGGEEWVEDPRVDLRRDAA